MHQILERTELVLSRMEKVKGRSINKLAVALITRDFDSELEKEWARHIGDAEELPELENLLKFVRPLSYSLARKKKSLSAAAPTFKLVSKLQTGSGE